MGVPRARAARFSAGFGLAPFKPFGVERKVWYQNDLDELFPIRYN